MTRSDSGTHTTIFVEGKILAPWIPEIRAALALIPPGQARRIDLAGVTLVDREGAELLEALRRDGIEIASCSGFVAELIGRHARSGLR
jgi:ferredoxin